MREKAPAADRGNEEEEVTEEAEDQDLHGNFRLFFVFLAVSRDTAEFFFFELLSCFN